ncbi:MAG: T9SS type A sorting domain-containing protein [Bacteroidetes bacterium]|nr:MAG: T9SS type A sorting domain-containing protein [Bacteroidota bacterium]
MKFKVLILTVTLFLFKNSWTQNEEVIESFSAEVYNESVLINFRINSGYTCNGIDVLHSTDSVNFSPVYTFEGICGSTTESIAYEYTHVNPVKNSKNYYRLYLGGPGFSWVINVLVIDLTNSSLIKPNPLISTSELIFENNAVTEHQLVISNMYGQIVFSETTNGSSIILNRNDFVPGVYVYSIIDLEKENRVTGRLMVQ